MEDLQKAVKKFVEGRDWAKPEYTKDVLLNITEEVSEFWNLIKYADTETQLKIIRENKKEVENFIGDLLFIVLKLASQFNIDASAAVKKVLEEHEKRFPVEKVKGKHNNKRAGGFDGK